jgi:parallel beta-helix repeat protein
MSKKKMADKNAAIILILLSISCLLAVGGTLPSVNALNRVQAQGSTDPPSKTSTTIPLTFTLTPTTGDSLVCVIGTYVTNVDNPSLSPTVTGISETGAVWSREVSERSADGWLNVEIWLAPSVSSAAAGLTVTLSGPHTGEYANAICAEYNAALTLDVTATATGTIPSAGGASTTGPITTTSPNEVLVGAVNANEWSESPGPSTNGFALTDNTNGKTSTGYLEKIVTATTTTSSGTSYNAFGEYVGAIAGFKISSVSAIACGSTITSSTTLTGNMVCSTSTGITVGANDITLNCAGYSITQTVTGTGAGIYLPGRTGVVVKNCIVNGWIAGIYLNTGSGNILTGNTASGTNVGGQTGFDFISSSGNILISNTASGNSYGFAFGAGSGNILTSNTASGGKYYGFYFSSSSGNILTSNTASGNTLAGFFLASSSGNTLASNTASGNPGDGFDLNPLTSSNTLALNAANSNGGYGYHDLSSGAAGAPTYGTANTYLANTDNGANTLGASSPAGLG